MGALDSTPCRIRTFLWDKSAAGAGWSAVLTRDSGGVPGATWALGLAASPIPAIKARTQNACNALTRIGGLSNKLHDIKADDGCWINNIQGSSYFLEICHGGIVSYVPLFPLISLCNMLNSTLQN
jgi:hypothetical protein